MKSRFRASATGKAINHATLRRGDAVLLAVALLLTMPLAAYADDDDNAVESARQLRARGVIVPLERIVEEAQRIHPGRMIATEFETKHGRYIYEIEILDKDGSVWELKFDATTGAFIKEKKED